MSVDRGKNVLVHHEKFITLHMYTSVPYSDANEPQLFNETYTNASEGMAIIVRNHFIKWPSTHQQNVIVEVPALLTIRKYTSGRHAIISKSRCKVGAMTPIHFGSGQTGFIAFMICS